MNWSEFNALVRLHMPNHADRQGVQPLLDQLIKGGSVELQQAIDAYQTGHTSEFGQDDVVAVGLASVGALPPGRLQQIRMVKRDPVTEVVDYESAFPVEIVSWDTYDQMVRGEVPAQVALFCINTKLGRFALTPALDETFRLVIRWDGLRYDFAPLDPVKFTPVGAQAVAEYAQARLCRMIEGDLTRASSHEKTFIQLKRRLFTEEAAKAHLPAH